MILRLREKQSGISLVCPTFSFGSRNLAGAEIACIQALSWLYFWDEVVLQGSLLISSKPAAAFGFLKHIS